MNVRHINHHANTKSLTRFLSITLCLAIAAVSLPRITGATNELPPATAAATQGFIDVAGCSGIAGWAADLNSLNTSINVKLFDGTTLLSTVLANQSRPDVGTFLHDNGLHGYLFSIPSSLRDGRDHSIHVFAENGGELQNSPRTINCTFLGNFTLLQPTSEITRMEIRTADSLAPLSTSNPLLTIFAQFDREPKVFRLGEVKDPDHPEADLQNLPWQTFHPGLPIQFRLNTTKPYGRRDVFMQISINENGTFPSRPKGDNIDFIPTSYKTFTLTGFELNQFLQRARELNYNSTVSGPTVSGSPCAPGLVPDPHQLIQLSAGQTAEYTESWRVQIFLRSDSNRFLNPFFKVKDIQIADIFKPGDAKDITMHGPNSGRDDDLQRSVDYKRGFSLPHDISLIPFVLGPVSSTLTCFAASVPSPPAVTSITLQGPADKTALDALRSNN